MSTNDSGMVPPPPGQTGPVGPPPAPAPTAPDLVAPAPGSAPHGTSAPQPSAEEPPHGAPAAPAFGSPAPSPFGAPTPGAPAPQQYGGHPSVPTLPPHAAYGPGPGGAPAGQKKGLVIAALVVSIVALLLSWVPFVNYFAAFLAVVGLVLGIIGLVGAVRHGRPGKGMAIAAVAVSAVSLLVVVLTGIAYSLVIDEVVGGLEESAAQLETPTDEPAVADDEQDAPAAGGSAVADLGVVEAAFGQSEYDPSTWWYVIIVENPNPEHALRFAGFDIEAVGADGLILDTGSNYVDMLPGRTALTGMFTKVGAHTIDHLEVRGPDISEAEHEPDLGAFTITDVAGTSDEWSTTVGGTLSGTFAEELTNVRIEVVVRDAAGQIVGSDSTYVDRLPAGGQARFESMFFDPLPEGTTFEVFAQL